LQKGASKGAAQKKSTLSWFCTFGEIRMEERWLRTDEVHHLRPFAERVKVSGRGKSGRLERAMSDFGAEHSFGSANKRLKEHYGFELNASAMRSATLKTAARAQKILREQYAKPFREVLAKGAAWLIAEADGSMLPTVAAGLRRDAKRPREWREIRLVCAQPQGSVETKYAATFGSVQEVGERWGHVAKEAGRGMNTRIHALGDGAEWLANQTREIFGDDAKLLIDHLHVSEYLSQAAPTCAPAAPEQWRRAQQTQLKTGASKEVIAALNPHCEPAEVSEENAPVRAAHRYLSNRAEHLDYKSAIDEKLPIGSGLIESSHKHVLQARLKVPGACWLLPHAEAIAQLRVLRANDRWDELWPLAA
jgi:hypothetical protein